MRKKRMRRRRMSRRREMRKMKGKKRVEEGEEIGKLEKGA